MKRRPHATLLAVLLCALLPACATTEKRVTADSEGYKSMARSQGWWCSQFGCECTIDGLPATCSLVAACLNSGNCKRAP